MGLGRQTRTTFLGMKFKIQMERNKKEKMNMIIDTYKL